MPKTAKAKKKVSKPKTKVASKPKPTTAKVVSKGPVKISKTYVQKDTEKYMCEKHKVFFRMKLQEWKKELIKANNEALYMVVWMTIVYLQILLIKQAPTQIKMLK